MRILGSIELADRDRRAVEAASKLLKERFPVEKVILFGSKARGDDDEESDIDLLLLTSRPLLWQEEDAITDALFDVEMSYEVVISTLIITVSEWNEGMFTVFPIHEEIVRDGVLAA